MEINQLQNQVDSLQNHYSEIDIEFFKEISVEIQQNMEYIQSHMDKIDMKDTTVSRYIGSYGTLWKTLSRTFKRGGANIETKLNESETQLSDLKHDVKNENLTNPDIIKRFLKSERNEVERLKTKMKTISKQFKSHRENYIRLQPNVNEIIESSKH